MSIDGIPVTSNAIGAQVLEYENASRIVDAMCKYEECGNSTPIALVVEEYFKREEGKSEVLSQDEDKEPDKGLRARGAGASIERTVVLEEPCDIFKSLNEDGCEAAEKSHEDGSKQIKLPNTHHLVPSFSFNEKTPQVPSASAPCPKRKSAVIKLSFKRRSCDGEETTEFCKSRPLCLGNIQFMFSKHCLTTV